MTIAEITSNVQHCLSNKIDGQLRLYDLKAYSASKARLLIGELNGLRPSDLYFVALGRAQANAKPCIGTLIISRSVAASCPDAVADCLARKLRCALRLSKKAAPPVPPPAPARR